MAAASLQEYILDCCEKHSSLLCCTEMRGDRLYTHTYAELLRDLRLMGSSLSSPDTVRRHVALLGRTSFEWIAAYLGALCYGTVAVPLNADAPAEDLLRQFRHADAEILVYDAAEETAAALIAEKTGCRLVCLNGTPGRADSFPPLRAKGAILPLPPAEPARVAEILFTSGTTGKPKAVMLTGDNILCSVLFGIESFRISPSSVAVSVLPNHHAYELAVGILIPLHFGVTIAAMDRMIRFVRNLAVIRPEVILAVPALLETLRKEILREQARGAEDALRLLGGNLKMLVCGGASLREEPAAFFRNLGIPVLQGYGLTECGPIVSCDSISRQYKLGRVSPFCQVICADGELLVRGRNVMPGYYKDPEETARVIRDGWFHTGDLGEVDPDGYLSLTGRLKNLIVLSNGENVSPEAIEDLLSGEAVIAGCRVFAEDDLIAAEIFPDRSGTGGRDPEEAVWAAVRRVNRTLPKYRQIERVHLRQHPFPMTATRKIIRNDPQGGTENE